MSIGSVRLDLSRREAFVRDEKVDLTNRQFDVLALLASDPGRAFSREEILREVWGPHATEVHVARVHVAELRKKIEAEPARPRLLVTEPGVGYRLRDRVEP